MSASEENKLLKMVIETQASRIAEQEATIKELHEVIDELRSVRANLEETIDEFKRQIFGISSEKTSPKKKDDEAATEETKTVKIKEHTRKRKPKATREDLYANLPIRTVLCKVPDSERFCEWCNAEMIPFGKPTFVREEIRITPAKIERIHYM